MRPRPGSEMSRGGEAGHVSPGLGHDHLGHRFSHPGDGLKQRYGCSKGSETFGHLLVQAEDGGIEEVDVVEDGPSDGGMVSGEASDERLGQRRDLRSQAAACHAGQDGRVPLAGDERLEHGPGGFAEHT